MSDPFEVRTSVRIAAPRAVVWEVLVDVERQPEWMRDALDVQVLTPGPVRVGTRMRVPTRIGIFRTTDFMEVTAFEPPVRWCVVHSGAVTGEGEFVLVEDGSGLATEVTWLERLQVPLGSFGRLGLRLVEPLLRRQFSSDLARLRDLCERARPERR